MEQKELHIKVPKDQYDFMKEFKVTFKITSQQFIVKAIQEKIDKIKQST